MTREETLGIMAVLSAAYPTFYRKSSPEDTKAAVALWAEMFKDDPASVVTAAVKALIKTRVEGFPPTIGEVAAKIAELTRPGEFSEMEAWAMVEKACQNGLYGYLEEYDRLPPVIQKTLGSPSQLKEWALMEPGQLHTVVASNFMRSFRTMQKREREMSMLPADVKAMLSGVSERLALK